MWLDEDTAPISQAYRSLLMGAATAFEDAGALVDYEARPSFTFEKAVDTYNHLLSAAEAATWTLSEIEEHAASKEEPQGELGIAYASLRHPRVAELARAAHAAKESVARVFRVV